MRKYEKKSLKELKRIRKMLDKLSHPTAIVDGKAISTEFFKRYSRVKNRVV